MGDFHPINHRFSGIYFILHGIYRRPTAQNLGHAPGLGDAAARRVGRLGVEDFADGTDAAFAVVIDEAVQKCPPVGSSCPTFEALASGPTVDSELASCL